MCVRQLLPKCSNAGTSILRSKLADFTPSSLRFSNTTVGCSRKRRDLRRMRKAQLVFPRAHEVFTAGQSVPAGEQRSRETFSKCLILRTRSGGMAIAGIGATRGT